jgi:phosphoribosylaminoimidazole-succinocarboxamide synthase
MTLYESKIKSLPRLGKGKVRDIYAVGKDKMLIVTSDRLSAFDVVLSDPIPDKGRVLNEMANFWFERLGHIVPNQLTGIDPESVVADDERAQVRGRSVVVKKAEARCRSRRWCAATSSAPGWKDYQRSGKICGIELPKGLQQAQKLPEPIFTPRHQGRVRPRREHQFRAGGKAHRAALARKVREVSIRLYKEAADYAGDQGHHHRRTPSSNSAWMTGTNWS